MVRVAVIGSCSVDLVVEAERRPAAGETLFGTRFFTTCGGKGANQAVAAARLGAEVYMVGAVGTDWYGKTVLDNLRSAGVDTTYVAERDDVATGTAHITLAEGDNSILVVPGANFSVTPADIDAAWSVLREADIVLLQHEIPLATVRYAVLRLAAAGIDVVLNPAPAAEIAPEVQQACRYITPNEHEMELMFPDGDIPQRMRDKLVVTRGSAGVDYDADGDWVRVPAFAVTAVDTTGAGDTFCSAFGVAIAEGKMPAEAIRFGNAAAALAVTGFGAQGAMPDRAKVEALLCNE